MKPSITSILSNILGSPLPNSTNTGETSSASGTSSNTSGSSSSDFKPKNLTGKRLMEIFGIVGINMPTPRIDAAFRKHNIPFDADLYDEDTLNAVTTAIAEILVFPGLGGSEGYMDELESILQIPKMGINQEKAGGPVGLSSVDQDLSAAIDELFKAKNDRPSVESRAKFLIFEAAKAANEVFESDPESFASCDSGPAAVIRYLNQKLQEEVKHTHRAAEVASTFVPSEFGTSAADSLRWAMNEIKRLKNELSEAKSTTKESECSPRELPPTTAVYIVNNDSVSHMSAHSDGSVYTNFHPHKVKSPERSAMPIIDLQTFADNFGWHEILSK